MAKIKKNGNIDLDHYRSKYSLLYYVGNDATEKKVEDMLVDVFEPDMGKFYDCLLDARNHKDG